MDSNQVLMLDLIGTLYVASVEFSFPSHMSENGVYMQNPRDRSTNAAAFLFSGVTHSQLIILIFQSLSWLIELLQGIKYWFCSENLCRA